MPVVAEREPAITRWRGPLLVVTVLLAASVLGLLVQPAAGSPAAPLARAGAPCAEPVDVALLGPSCPVDGGWLVVLGDGSTMFTHGPDAPTHLIGVSPLATPVAPPCVSDPSSDYHGEVVYALPTDRTDRYASMRDEIRTMVGEANGLLRAEAGEFGRTLDYRMRCDSDGAVTVWNVPLSTAAADTRFASVVNDLAAAGYGSPRVKYWVWVDVPPSGGFGNLWGDDRAVPFNRNNSGPSYGVTFGSSASVMMHENGHNLGAVQLSAPHTSGAWHCNDGLDIMCYPDGGPSSHLYSSGVCSVVRFDCNHDDYLHPDPPAGNYLATRWNLGSPLNRFVEGCLYEAGLRAGAVTGLEALMSVDLPVGCRDGHRFAFTASFTVGPVTFDGEPDVCWYDGTTLLRCDERSGFEAGVVPTGATRAELSVGPSLDPSYFFSIV